MKIMSEPYFHIEHLEAGDTNVRAEIVFPPSHPLYGGHFPGRPVVPGVVVLEVMRALLRQSWNMDPRIRTARALKFLQPMLPSGQDRYIVQVDVTGRSEGRLVLNAEFRLGDHVCTRLRDLEYLAG